MYRYMIDWLIGYNWSMHDRIVCMEDEEYGYFCNSTLTGFPSTPITEALSRPGRYIFVVVRRV